MSSPNGYRSSQCSRGSSMFTKAWWVSCIASYTSASCWAGNRARPELRHVDVLAADARCRRQRREHGAMLLRNGDLLRRARPIWLKYKKYPTTSGWARVGTCASHVLSGRCSASCATARLALAVKRA